MCIKSVFESINSIRHNVYVIVMKAILRVYDTISNVRLSHLLMSFWYYDLSLIWTLSRGVTFG